MALKKITGFTLIELLVVTALFAVLGAVSSNILISILRSQNKAAIITEARQNGDLVINKFERDVRSAKEIRGVGMLDVDMVRADGLSIQWFCVGNIITRSEDVGPVVPVMNNDPVTGVLLVPGSCEFTLKDSIAGVPQLVVFEFTLEQGPGAPNRNQFEIEVPFQVTVSTRKY